MGNKTTLSSNKGCPEPEILHLIDPKTVKNLTFTAQVLIPANFCPAFLCKPGSIFSPLKTAFGTLVHCLLGGGFIEVNSFLVSTTTHSLTFGSVNGEWLNLVCSDFRIKVLLHLWALVTILLINFVCT